MRILTLLLLLSSTTLLSRAAIVSRPNRTGTLHGQNAASFDPFHRGPQHSRPRSSGLQPLASAGLPTPLLPTASPLPTPTCQVCNQKNSADSQLSGTQAAILNYLIMATPAQRPTPLTIQNPSAVVQKALDIDPTFGAFLGGFPNQAVDLTVTLIFLLLFEAGAHTHISIYRANAARGHKFLISDLVFDFCMIRIVTCIFRTIWVFNSARGVILVALIVENGG
jgi:hypothetical protein